MLPFVVGGGILIAIAFLIDGLCVDMNALDVAERSNFGTITPLAAMFKSVGGVAFGFMLPVLQTLLWDWHLLQKVQYLLRHLTHCMYFHPVS